MASGPTCLYEAAWGECGDAATVGVSTRHRAECGCGWARWSACVEHARALCEDLAVIFTVSEPYPLGDLCARWWAERRAA